MIRNFTDIYGSNHPLAIMTICRAAKQTSTEEVIDMDTDLVPEMTAPQFSIYYRMCFWTNQQTKDDGFDPMEFVFKNEADHNASSFRFALTTEYDGMTVEQATLHHFETCIFPEGKVPGYYNQEV